MRIQDEQRLRLHEKVRLRELKRRKMNAYARKLEFGEETVFLETRFPAFTSREDLSSNRTDLHSYFYRSLNTREFNYRRVLGTRRTRNAGKARIHNTDIIESIDS